MEHSGNHLDLLKGAANGEDIFEHLESQHQEMNHN